MSPSIQQPAATSSGASRKILVILALLLFVVALTLVIVQSITGTKTPVLKTYNQGYIDGYTKARNKAMSFGILIPEEVTQLTGMITSIEGDSIYIDASNVFVDERVDGVGSERIVKVTADTVIIALAEKDPEQLNREMETFGRTLGAPGEEPQSLPNPMEESEISLSDLSPGDRVTVTGVDGENLKFLESFVAGEIKKSPVAAPAEDLGAELPAGEIPADIPQAPPVTDVGTAEDIPQAPPVDEIGEDIPQAEPVIE